MLGWGVGRPVGRRDNILVEGNSLNVKSACVSDEQLKAEPPVTLRFKTTM